MSNTRTAPPGIEKSVTANLASSKLMGVKAGLNLVAHVARIRPDAERSAMLWLTNYAHLHDLTADALGAELGADKAEIRRALTDREADLSRLCRWWKCYALALKRVCRHWQTLRGRLKSG